MSCTQRAPGCNQSDRSAVRGGGYGGATTPPRPPPTDGPPSTRTRRPVAGGQSIRPSRRRTPGPRLVRRRRCHGVGRFFFVLPPPPPRAPPRRHGKTDDPTTTRPAGHPPPRATTTEPLPLRYFGCLGCALAACTHAHRHGPAYRPSPAAIRRRVCPRVRRAHAPVRRTDDNKLFFTAFPLSVPVTPTLAPFYRPSPATRANRPDYAGKTTFLYRFIIKRGAAMRRTPSPNERENKFRRRTNSIRIHFENIFFPLHSAYLRFSYNSPYKYKDTRFSFHYYYFYI